MTSTIIRFKDSRMAIVRRKTEHAAWRAALAHGVPGESLEAVPEDQHIEDLKRDNRGLPQYPTTYNLSAGGAK